MSKQEQIDLLRKVYRMVNNKQTLTTLEIAQIRDYVDMVANELEETVNENRVNTTICDLH